MSLPPQDWEPQTTLEIVRGKLVRVWRWKGHELAYRGPEPQFLAPDVNPAWQAFRAETHAIKAALEAGAPHVSYAHRDRHNLAKRKPEHSIVGRPTLPPAEESIRIANERHIELSKDLEPDAEQAG